MNPLRSVGARLSLGLFVAVAAALLIVYLILVPSLERRLINAKIGRLEKISTDVVKRLPKEEQRWQLSATDESARFDVRIVLFRIDRNAGRVSIHPQVDSHGDTSTDVENDTVALEAAAQVAPAHGTVRRDDTRYAEVAVPVTDSGPVLLLAASLADTLGTIHLVERRLLAGGLIALLAALAFGYGTASLFARRIRRLERAADRIAGGRFDEPVVGGGSDELGQLATAFERMRERLSELENARREFIANASHELRTPIFSLSGFLELLADEDLDEETRREFLETMREQVARLTRLATDLLDLSRVDAGRLRVERERVDLAEIAEALAAEFGALAKAGGHALAVVADEGAVAALADEQRVLQIGRILVENALVHTPAGTRIELSASPRAEGARLAVEDDGPGIARDKLPHVFERFYRLDGAVTSGSGLGLAIARDLATLMGGSVEVRSEAGRTTFTLTVPAAASSERPAARVFTGKRSLQ